MCRLVEFIINIINHIKGKIKMNKFNEIYQQIINESYTQAKLEKLAEKDNVDAKYTLDKVNEQKFDAYAKVRNRLEKIIFSKEAKNSYINQLDFLLQDDSRFVNLKGTLVSELDSTNPEFEFDEKLIEQLCLKYLKKNFDKIFIEHEEL